PATSTSKAPDASDVTVCLAESLLITVTCAPGGTVTSEYLNPSIVIVGPVAAGDGDDTGAEVGVGDEDIPVGALGELVSSVTLDFPQAGASRIVAAASVTVAILMGVIAFTSLWSRTYLQ